jgi:cytoskeleton protein RodZ
MASHETGRRGIGRLLRLTRESREIELTEVAKTLRIRLAYLEAIEHATYDQLPGPVYVLGFVRAYAEYLGLDGEEAVRRFKREDKALESQPDLSFPVPLAERSIPGGRILVTALVLAICGYGVWYYMTRGVHPRPEQVSAVPAELLPPKPVARPDARNADAATPEPPIAPQPKAAKSDAATAASSPAPPQNVAAVTPPASEPAAPVAAAPEANTGIVYGDAAAPARILVRAKADSWVQVKDAHQEIRFGKLLHAGDVYRVPNEAGLVLRTGNGSGLAISVDGTAVPSLAEGTVRNLALDPARLLAGKASLSNSASSTSNSPAATSISPPATSISGGNTPE